MKKSFLSTLALPLAIAVGVGGCGGKTRYEQIPVNERVIVSASEGNSAYDTPGYIRFDQGDDYTFIDEGFDGTLDKVIDKTVKDSSGYNSVFLPSDPNFNDYTKKYQKAKIRALNGNWVKKENK